MSPAPGDDARRRHRAAGEAFDRLRKLPAAERAAALDRESGEDRDLRVQLEGLLAADLTGAEDGLGRPRLRLAEPASILANEAASSLAGKPGDRNAVDSRLQPGDVLAGRYRIDRYIARGGMGEVYEAHDLELDVALALKTMRAAFAVRPGALARFKQEVLLARSVTHPGICRIYTLDWHRQGEVKVAVLTMELLAGETLQARLQRDGRMAADEALPIVRQMAEALAAAHAAGVVHRDFKSANVILVPGSGGARAVVTDFGLALAVQRGGDPSESAAAERFAGTPAYMAPEQVRGEWVGPPADLYALGVVLFEMMTGGLPFVASSSQETARMRLSQPPRRPRDLVPDLDPRWEAVILRLLLQEPAARFAGALDAVAALTADPVAPIAVVVAVRHTLPPDLNAFVGRESELLTIANWLAEKGRLLSLLGPGGIGKTRLARRVGWSSLEGLNGGVWFCDLSEATSNDGVLGAISLGLGIALGRDDPGAQLGHAIAGRGRTLVILDNCEQVVMQLSPTLDRWLRLAPEASFLVTTRERLRLEGETVLALEPLPVEREAVELLQLRAKAQRPDWVVTDTDRAAVAEVARLLDGLPLALELAAARARVLRPAELRDRLRDRFRLLVGGAGAARQGTLRATLDWSWDLLLPWERAAFCQASVFAASFPLEAAEAVLDLMPWPEAPSVLDAIQMLVDKSLLRTLPPRNDGSGTPIETRFGMYLRVREYAAERLLADGAIAGGGSGAEAERRALERHGTYFAGFGRRPALGALNGPDGPRLRLSLRLLLDDLVAVCRRPAPAGNPELRAAALTAVWEVLQQSGPVALGAVLGEEVATACAADSAEHAAALLVLGRAQQVGGRIEDARNNLEKALRIRRARGEENEAGRLLSYLGVLHQGQGRADQTHTLLREAIAIHRRCDDPVAALLAEHNLAIVLASSGELEEARRLYERGVAEHRQAGRLRWEALSTSNLGQLLTDLGHMVEAEEFLIRALELHRRLGDRRFEAMTLGNLGILHKQTGRCGLAHDDYQAALTINRELGIRGSEGVLLDNLGLLLIEEGKLGEALECLTAALALFRAVGWRRYEGVALADLGQLHLRAGRLEEAGAVLAEAETLLGAANDRLNLARALCCRGEVEHAAGRPALARVALDRAEALARELGTVPGSSLASKLAGLRAEVEPV